MGYPRAQKCHLLVGAHSVALSHLVMIQIETAPPEIAGKADLEPFFEIDQIEKSRNYLSLAVMNIILGND